MQKDELEAALESSRKSLTGKIQPNASENVVISKLLSWRIYFADLFFWLVLAYMHPHVTLGKFNSCTNWLLLLFCESVRVSWGECYIFFQVTWNCLVFHFQFFSYASFFITRRWIHQEVFPERKKWNYHCKHWKKIWRKHAMKGIRLCKNCLVLNSIC